MKKFLRNFDNFSEEVKLYSITSKKTRHQTAVGGILSIIAFSMSAIISVILLSSLIIRTNPKAYQVTRYSDDTSKIQFDQTGIFFVIRF